MKIKNVSDIMLFISQLTKNNNKKQIPIISPKKVKTDISLVKSKTESYIPSAPSPQNRRKPFSPQELSFSSKTQTPHHTHNTPMYIHMYKITISLLLSLSRRLHVWSF